MRADQLYVQMSQQSGSSAIAKLEALELIQVFLELRRSSHEPILEVGGGLGTITKMLLRLTKSPIVSLEYQEECIRKLQKLEKMSGGRLKVVDSIPEVAFEVIIVDGPYKPREMRSAINASRGLLRWIAFEGGRTESRVQISHFLFLEGYRQMSVEFRSQNYRPALTIFFVDWNQRSTPVQITLDYLLNNIRNFAKYLRLLLNRNGHKHLGVANRREGEFGVLR